MADTIQPSFIPHDAKVTRGNSGINELVMLLAIVLFVASVALAVGVFIYQQYLAKDNTDKLASLNRTEAAFDPSLVKEFTRLDDRMTAASTILQQHVAPLAFFTMLEQTTISTISFTSLNFDAGDSQHISIKLSGAAHTVNSVALQSDLFAKTGAISNPIFSNIDRSLGGVHFDVSANINPSTLNYVQLFNGQSSTNQIPQSSGIQPQSTGETGQQSGAQGGSASANVVGNPNPFGGTSNSGPQGKPPATSGQ